MLFKDYNFIAQNFELTNHKKLSVYTILNELSVLLSLTNIILISKLLGVVKYLFLSSFDVAYIITSL